MPRKNRPIGPNSRPPALAKMDGRTRHAKHVAAVRTELLAHCGGKPSATQRALIDRCAMLSMHLAIIDARTVNGRGMTDHDARAYIAWSNAYARTLAKVGLRGAAPPTRTLADHIAATAP